jgi:PTH1 family peptidyl-tRNA hydrolase
LWAIVGLGNPGSRYSKTRHNIGFMVVDTIARRLGIDLKESATYKYGKGSMEGIDIVLIEPLTFMNRSGSAVIEAMRRFDVRHENLIAVHDDLDIETGRLKIRRGGSSGGHKGIDSIIQSIGKDFIRMKIGIGRDPSMAPEDFVLKKFDRSEIPVIEEAIITASEAVECVVLEGVEKAMNRYNRKRLTPS